MTLDVQAILEEFNTVGTRLSLIDSALAQATALNFTSGRGDLMQPHVSTAHDAVAIAGLAMAKAAKLLDDYIKASSATTAPPTAPTPRKPAPPAQPRQQTLPPGKAVADVGGGDGAWRGPVDGRTLTLGNWAYIANHMGQFSNKWGDVFNGPFVMGDPARPDHVWTQGDLANAVEDSQIPGGRNLADFI